MFFLFFFFLYQLQLDGIFSCTQQGQFPFLFKLGKIAQNYKQCGKLVLQNNRKQTNKQTSERDHQPQVQLTTQAHDSLDYGKVMVKNFQWRNGLSCKLKPEFSKLRGYLFEVRCTIGHVHAVVQCKWALKDYQDSYTRSRRTYFKRGLCYFMPHC